MDLCDAMYNMQLWPYSVVYSAAGIRCAAKEYKANVH